MTKVELIKKHMESAAKSVELADNIEKLLKNGLFKKVILNSYFEDEAVRLVSLLSNGSLQDAENQKNITNAMRGIGELRSWFDAMIQRGMHARKTLADLEKELVYAEQEPDEVDSDNFSEDDNE